MKKEKQTGYPSVDKPWLKYYSEEACSAKLPECTIYEYLRRDNTDRRCKTALRYVNQNITYGELFENIDIAAQAWASAGIKQGDIVVGLTPSMPELIYSFYGLNKIGAICDFFDPRTVPAIVAEELKQTRAKAVLLFDGFAERFAGVIERSAIKLVVIISAGDSLKGLPKFLFRLKRKKSVISRGCSYSEFVQRRNQNLKTDTVKNATHIPALMEHTGGTTGTPKAVVLSNQNVNCVAHQYRISGMKFSPDDSWLLLGFPFTAYTLIVNMHIPLCIGIFCYMCFTTEIPKMEKMILKYKINHVATTPLFWRGINSKVGQTTDYSFLIMPTTGADMLDIGEEKEINNFLKTHSCPYNIVKGYGLTEVGSGVSVCISNECNKLESVGIPFVNTDISIFEIGSDRELPYGEQGEVCISGPSVMLGYFDDQKATDEVKQRHSDGKIWIHSGDLGHMDEDGFLFIDGRLKRMIIDHHGFKIFAPQVEQALSEIHCVKKCCVVGAPDRQYNNGQIAVAYIILRDGTAEDTEFLMTECAKKLPEYCVPSKFFFVKKFPYTGAGKVDYRKLEEKIQ